MENMIWISQFITISIQNRKFLHYTLHSMFWLIADFERIHSFVPKAVLRWMYG